MSASASTRPHAGASGHRTDVDVLYAASLTELMESQIGPAFDAATGYHFVGFPGGSKGLATQIRSHLQVADVFISASPAVDKTLQGKANGNWVSSYTAFAKTYLELGYNRASTFARQLRAKPWYRVVIEPGFRLGRTDPAVDPKGVLTEQVLDGAAARYHVPALKSLATSASDVFPEESLVGRLQSGQLDAGFFYQVEAVAARLPTVPLAGYHLAATYTYAVVNRAPHRAGAEAFVRFLTGTKGQATLARDGLGRAG
jgi:molybdate/tungstate transport system substrate-binding protein